MKLIVMTLCSVLMFSLGVAAQEEGAVTVDKQADVFEAIEAARTQIEEARTESILDGDTELMPTAFAQEQETQESLSDAGQDIVNSATAIDTPEVVAPAPISQEIEMPGQISGEVYSGEYNDSYMGESIVAPSYDTIQDSSFQPNSYVAPFVSSPAPIMAAPMANFGCTTPVVSTCQPACPAPVCQTSCRPACRPSCGIRGLLHRKRGCGLFSRLRRGRCR